MMVLEEGGKNYRAKVLLDTGFSISLINQRTVEKLGLPLQQHNLAVPIENVTGQLVEGAGQYYTKSLLLQHQRHVTRECFEVAPMEEGTDIFLPAGGLLSTPPRGRGRTQRYDSTVLNAGKNAPSTRRPTSRSPGTKESCTIQTLEQSDTYWQSPMKML